MQWTLAYAAAAYTLLHGMEMVSAAMHWPEVVVRVSLFVLVLGLPVVVILAWYHGQRAQHRVSGPELTMLTVTFLVAGSILWYLARPNAEPTPTASVGASAPTATTPVAPRTSIAVMPFANLTGDTTKDYLGDGMAEELINTLTKVPGLRVPARTSTFSYKGRNTDAKQIAKDLSVGTILEGSVRTAGTTIRITAQLIDAQSDSHLWSQTYDRKFTDLFKLQDDLAKAIVQALQVNLNVASRASVIQAPPTQDVEAYQLYLQGWSLANRPTEQNLDRAVEYFQQAIARDPKFARAYAGIANAHMRLGVQLGLRPFENVAAAEQAARQALALDLNIADAHSVLSGVYHLRGNGLEGEAHSLAALSLGGNDGYIHLVRALNQLRVGHIRDSIAEGRKAIELAPANPFIIANIALLYSLSGRNTQALKYADVAVDLAYPKDSEPLATVYSDAALSAGHYTEAADIAIKALRVSDPEQARTAEVIKLVHAALENPGQRASAVAAQVRLYPPPAVNGNVADLTDVGPCLESSFRYALLGAPDAAYGLANRCLDRMAPGAVFGGRSSIRLWSPWLRSFRQDARFQAFVTRLGSMEYFQQYGPPDDCDLKDAKLTCR
jgi:adenylate cyclase